MVLERADSSRRLPAVREQSMRFTKSLKVLKVMREVLSMAFSAMALTRARIAMERPAIAASSDALVNSVGDTLGDDWMTMLRMNTLRSVRRRSASSAMRC